MRSRILLLTVALLLVGTLGCSPTVGNPVDGEPSAVPTAVPPPTEIPPATAPPTTAPTSTEPPAEPVDVATLIINNHSGQIICYVRVSPATSSAWGEDRLGPTGLIGVDETRTFEVPPGTYDLRAEDCGNNEIDVQRDVDISDAYTWDVQSGPPLEGTGTLILNNNSDQTIYQVRISSASTAIWGDDQLGDSEVIVPGESRIWSDLPADIYDLRAEDCDYIPIDSQWGVSLSGMYTWNVGD